MKSTPFLTLILFSIFFDLSAQDLKRQMISSQGASVVTTSGIRVMQTIGQQSTTGSSSGDLIVQQGYQQSFWKILLSQNEINTNAIKLYPNPASEYLYVHFGELTQLPLQLTLFDLNGRLVYSESLQIENFQISIDVSDLDTGMYLVQLKGSKLNYYSKILVN
ncbi:T9SS type A sorting domain-containing protein [Nonlabens sp.]|uniref:T9SS type A sorting domain-containing protein n=1 Tax=Nonlabens sp. TaxID=1888209 RepID=UPI001BCB5DA5|nr:T9SS type A sorting domain-containing protein [Nonlabens sp.]